MVSQTYLLEKPAPPRGLHSYVDQKVLPAAANAAFAIERRIEAIAEAVREHPLTTLAATAGFAMLIGRLAAPNSRAVPRQPNGRVC